jgi:hypothetical protein
VKKWAKKNKQRESVAKLLIEAYAVAKEIGHAEDIESRIRSLEEMDKPIKQEKEVKPPTPVDMLYNVRRQVETILLAGPKKKYDPALVKLARDFNELDLSTNLLHAWDHQKNVGCIWQRCFSGHPIREIRNINSYEDVVEAADKLQ